MNTNYLTKSKFKLAIECSNKLYYANHPEIYENRNNEDKFMKALSEGGYQIEAMARSCYPGGVYVSDRDPDAAVERTRSLLTENENITLFEGAFIFENCYIRADITEKTGSEIKIFEVKSKAFDGSRPAKDQFLTKRGSINSKWLKYFYDAAFQYYTVSNAMPEYQISVYLVMPDKTRRNAVDGLGHIFGLSRNSDGEPSVRTGDDVTPNHAENLLIRITIGQYVQMIIDGNGKPESMKIPGEATFKEKIKAFSQQCREDSFQLPVIGEQCKNCEFNSGDESLLLNGYRECWRETLGDNFDFDKPHIFDLANFRKNKELMAQGIYYMEDIPSEYVEGSGAVAGRQRLQIERTLHNRVEYINCDLKQKMNQWNYPLHFIDFETMRAAVPFARDMMPYQQTAFQFSCHTVYEDGQIQHREFISDRDGVCPNFEFVNELYEVIGLDNGSVFCYAGHENSVLLDIKKEMKEYLAEYGVHPEYDLERLISFIETLTREKQGRTERRGIRCMVDMCNLVRKYYYHPLMNGSNSIKKVFPAVMSESSFLKEKYSKPLEYGTMLQGKVLWVPDGSGRPLDPYSLLDPVLEGEFSYVDGDGVINEGTGAMTAYAEIQYTDITEEEKKIKVQLLKQYCELDTLAMLMIYEHWRDCLG